jgi:hypothetical protein
LALYKGPLTATEDGPFRDLGTVVNHNSIQGAICTDVNILSNQARVQVALVSKSYSGK